MRWACVQLNLACLEMLSCPHCSASSPVLFQISAEFKGRACSKEKKELCLSKKSTFNHSLQWQLAQ